MRSFKYFTGLICLLLIVSGLLAAQPDVSKISLKLGTIRHFQAEETAGKAHALSPELEFGGRLMMASTQWSLYWRFWDDGISEPLPVTDFITYSYQSNIIGGRISYLFMEDESGKPLSLKLGFFLGVSHHFVDAHYVAGAGFDDSPGKNFSSEFNAFDFGVQINFRLHGALNMLLEMEQILPINAENRSFNKNRRAYKTGLLIYF